MDQDSPNLECRLSYVSTSRHRGKTYRQPAWYGMRLYHLPTQPEASMEPMWHLKQWVLIVLCRSKQIPLRPKRIFVRMPSSTPQICTRHTITHTDKRIARRHRCPHRCCGMPLHLNKINDRQDVFCVCVWNVEHSTPNVTFARTYVKTFPDTNKNSSTLQQVIH